VARQYLAAAKSASISSVIIKWQRHRESVIAAAAAVAYQRSEEIGKYGVAA